MTSWLRRGRRGWLPGMLAGLLLAGGSGAEPGAPAELRSLSGPALRAECERLDALGDPAAGSRWEELAARGGRDSHALWRAARAHHRQGERLPLDARLERLTRYQRALANARRGRILDPRCGECCLYEFAALGRIVSIQGFASSAVHLREMSALVELCSATPPTHADSEHDQEHANLWYGLASYYRAVPDSRLLGALTGARGDPALAVSYVERAVATAPDRIDYQVELGASLLCFGERRADPAAQMRGMATLRAVGGMPIRQSTDEIDRMHAATLLARPDEACGYSRDRWPAAQEALAGNTSVPVNANASGAHR